MTGMQAVAKWRAGFRVSLVRTPALPRSRREEVGSLARVYARFAPNFGRGAEARRVRQTSPPDAGRNPVAGRKWINSGRKRAVYNLRGPPLWTFATACIPMTFAPTSGPGRRLTCRARLADR